MLKITKIPNLSYFSDRCSWVKPRFRLKSDIMNHSSGLIVCCYWCLVTIKSVFKLGTIFCHLIAKNTDLVFSWLESVLFIPFRVDWTVYLLTFKKYSFLFFSLCNLKILKCLPRPLFLSLLIIISEIFSNINNFGWIF